MSMTDPIADMLTRVRNGIQARQTEVTVSASSLKLQIASILKEEGYIKDFKQVTEGKFGAIKITLKYGAAKKSAIASIKRVSKPGLRIYVGKDEIPKVLNGLGIAIVSTSKGLMTDRLAREKGMGGELICTVY